MSDSIWRTRTTIHAWLWVAAIVVVPLFAGCGPGRDSDSPSRDGTNSGSLTVAASAVGIDGGGPTNTAPGTLSSKLSTLSVLPAVGNTGASGPPISFTAVGQKSAEVTWAVTAGHGTVVPAKGSTVRYIPDPTDLRPNGTAVITATLGHVSQRITVHLNFVSSARFRNPEGLAVDPKGNIYVADWRNHRVRMISPGGIVSTVAGSAAGFADGPAGQARFAEPQGIAIGPDGSLYVADVLNCVVRKISADHLTVSTLAGAATQCEDKDGAAAVARFGNVFVADATFHKIRKISAAHVVTTFAGDGFCSIADGDVAQAEFCAPTGVALDRDGALFVSDTGNGEIRKIAGGKVTTVASLTDGTTVGAPAQLVVNTLDGALYVVGRHGHRVVKISADGRTSTVAGLLLPGSTDGYRDRASFSSPGGLAIDASGALFVGDSGNNMVRMISAQGWVSTLAGALEKGDADGTALPRN